MNYKDSELSEISDTDIQAARAVAKIFNNSHITTETLLYALLKNDNFVAFCNTCDPVFNKVELTQNVEKLLNERKVKNPVESPEPSYEFEVVIKRAYATTFLLGLKKLNYIEFIRSILVDYPHYENYFAKVNTFVENETQQIMTGKAAPKEEFEKYTTLMTAEDNIQNLVTVTARETELKEIERVLLRKSKNSVILTGEPGVGKTSIVESFAKMITEGKIHNSLKDVKIFALNITALLSDIKFYGVLEARLSAIIDTMTQNPNYILFIDEMHMLHNAGGSNSNLDVMNFLKIPLSKNKVRVIGSTTTSDFRKYIEKNAAFTRRFCHVHIKEPSVIDTVYILKNVKNEFENFYDIQIEDEIIEEVVKLTHTYVKNRFNPDKSIDVLDSLLSRKKLENIPSVSKSDVYKEISIECRIPTDEISKNKSDQLEFLKERLNDKIVGQGTIFDDVIDTLYVSMAGLRDQQKPMASFLFQGQTSSGKTATAVIMSETLGIPLIRYDMSAFQEKHLVTSLIGAPPSYVGYSEDSGRLVSDIKKNPHCVLLFDEIEKAHPDVMNILLQIMDYGKLTSSSGEDAYFNKVIIIMTSNLGSHAGNSRSIGFSSLDRNHSDEVDASISDFLRPEFRARLDGILKFNRLTRQDIRVIIRKQLETLNHDLSKFNLALTFGDEVLDHIADKAIESKLNARFISTYIQRNIKPKISKMILNNVSTEMTVKNIFIKDSKIELN